MNNIRVQMLADKLSKSYDSDVADALYREIIHNLQNTAYHVLKDEHLARDAAHDAFTNVLSELRNGHRLSKVVSYFQKAAPLRAFAVVAVSPSWRNCTRGSAANRGTPRAIWKAPPPRRWPRPPGRVIPPR